MSAVGAADPIEVWIDLANSPHPLLFAPVARRMEELGHRVLVTARDHAQTVELARPTWPGLEVVGAPSPASRLGKARGILARSWRLRGWARTRRPHLALSHNSYAQIVAARALGIRVVTAMDFEHQQANHLAFRVANRVLLPEAVPLSAVRRQGASSFKVRRYPGLKEGLYLGDFEPDPAVLRELGVSRAPGQALVVARTPPARALYHRFGNPLFAAALEAIGRQRDVLCVVLSRYPEQARELTRMGLANLIIPRSAIDSRSLMYEADLVLGAGGTMTREAALMGIPTFTVFAGRPPAVDRWLEERGHLRRLTDPEQVATVERRARGPRGIDELRRAGQATTAAFVEAALS